jgi:hypothetical protein
MMRHGKPVKNPGVNVMSTRGIAMIMALAAGLTIAPVPLAAQSAQDRLTSATTLACAFPVVATGTWTKGAPQAAVKTSKLAIQFNNIDRDDGTARVIGDFGPSEIIVRISGGTLHFVQSFREGPLYITTVFPKETHDGRLQATHSRHEYTAVTLPGFTSRPEQYYGDCEVRP